MDDNWDVDTQLVFNTYEDIASRPNFKTEIDTSTSTIYKLIAVYSFPNKQHCGKKGCHQPHNNGWLAVTTDGQETLIGSKCGLEWGGDKFSLEKTQLNRRVKRDTQLKAYYQILQDADLILDKVNEIKTRSKGADWLAKTIKKLEDACTFELMRMIRLRASRGETTITIETLKTKEERDIEAVSKTGGVVSPYKVEIIGSLVGLELFKYDLREVLMIEIYKKLQDMRLLNPTTLPTPTLNSLVKDAGAFRLLFKQSEDILSYADRFFSTTNNFKLIKMLDKENKHNHLTTIKWFENQ